MVDGVQYVMMDGMMNMLVWYVNNLDLGLQENLADFGAGTGSIFLEKVMCSSNDTILASCGHYGVGISVHCNHYDDVGVKCDGNLRVCFILYILTSAFRCNNSVRNYANS